MRALFNGERFLSFAIFPAKSLTQTSNNYAAPPQQWHQSRAYSKGKPPNYPAKDVIDAIKKAQELKHLKNGTLFKTDLPQQLFGYQAVVYSKQTGPEPPEDPPNKVESSPENKAEPPPDNVTEQPPDKVNEQPPDEVKAPKHKRIDPPAFCDPPRRDAPCVLAPKKRKETRSPSKQRKKANATARKGSSPSPPKAPKKASGKPLPKNPSQQSIKGDAKRCNKSPSAERKSKSSLAPPQKRVTAAKAKSSKRGASPARKKPPDATPIAIKPGFPDGKNPCADKPAGSSEGSKTDNSGSSKKGRDDCRAESSNKNKKASDSKAKTFKINKRYCQAKPSKQDKKDKERVGSKKDSNRKSSKNDKKTCDCGKECKCSKNDSKGQSPKQGKKANDCKAKSLKQDKKDNDSMCSKKKEKDAGSNKKSPASNKNVCDLMEKSTKNKKIDGDSKAKCSDPPKKPKKSRLEDIIESHCQNLKKEARKYEKEMERSSRSKKGSEDSTRKPEKPKRKMEAKSSSASIPPKQTADGKILPKTPIRNPCSHNASGKGKRDQGDRGSKTSLSKGGKSKKEEPSSKSKEPKGGSKSPPKGSAQCQAQTSKTVIKAVPSKSKTTIKEDSAKKSNNKPLSTIALKPTKHETSPQMTIALKSTEQEAKPQITIALKPTKQDRKAQIIEAPVSKPPAISKHPTAADSKTSKAKKKDQNTKDNSIQKLLTYPVIPLNETLQRYLCSVKPLLSKKAFKLEQKITKDFQENEGTELQALLEKAAKSKGNWLTERWTNGAYLRVRCPVTVYTSPCMAFPLQKFLDPIDYVTYAAKCIYGMLEFKKLVDSNKIPVVKMCQFELDNSQFGKIFGGVRIPMPKLDIIEQYNDSDYIVVINKNNFYKLPVYNANGEIVHAHAMRDQLNKIIKGQNEPGETVGLLTHDTRDNWAEVHECLMREEHNCHTLNVIEQALFTVSLDEHVDLPAEGEVRALQAAHLLHGGGRELNSANRWMDKTLQLIVNPNGFSGICFEHSPADCQPLAMLMDFVQQNICQPGYGCESCNDEKIEPITPLRFDALSKCTELYLNVAERRIDKLSSHLQLHIFTFDCHGKNFIMAQGLNTDSYIQMALQLAFFMLHNVLPAQYESAHLRIFKEGRTETIRSTSSESRAFVKSIMSLKSSKKDRMEALRGAVDAHQELTKLALQGRGVDRHLFGLQQMVRENKLPMPEFFKSAGYSKSINYRVFSSQVATTHDAFLAYGPLTTCGYGCCYNPRDNDIIFSLSAWRTAKVTCAKKYGKAINKALNTLRKLVLDTGGDRVSIDLCKCDGKSNKK